MNRRQLLATALLLLTAPLARAAEPAGATAQKIPVLLIDGQNNHAWAKTTPLIKAALDQAGLFAVDVQTAPAKGQKMDDFKPDFSKYAVVVSNYNGEEWSADTKAAFEKFVGGGGGFVSVHAANNSFPKWAEYNKMIGVGGWGGRNQASGPMLRFRDGKVVVDNKPGGRGSHGKKHEFVVEARQPEHPIIAGLPAKWMHTADELYGTLGGPAENVNVLATAYSAKETGGTGENEPMLMTISYGKGRVFHTTLGHDETSMKCVGFVVTLNRGTEWAATGKVTQKVPAEFPTAEKASVWTPPAK
jgi:type 1 glutamine amidotransferase